MLKHLEIDNYILIDHLKIDFFQGFSAITGETGAGKSIILGALGLILGNRADTQALLDKGKKCTIEGSFHVQGYGLEPFFRENDLDYDPILILRREISPTGKSRAFINDTPVNLPQMRELGIRLVDIHSQNSVMTLNQADFQLAVLDSFAGASDRAADYRNQFIEYVADLRRLDHLTAEEAKAKSDEDYVRFLLEELDAAALKEGEQQELEDALNLLTHAEDIKENLFSAQQSLSAAEMNVLGMLSEVQAILRKIAAYHHSVPELLERLASGALELKDIAGEITGALEATEYDPEELRRLQERLDLIYRLQAKHHVSSLQDLADLKEKLRERLASITSLDEQIAGLNRKVELHRSSLASLAGELSKIRNSAAGAFEKEIEGLLSHMGMPRARFRIQMTSTENLSKDGTDKLIFLFNANPGHELKPLSDTASGGELSRVMLGIKAMITVKNLLPTIILDEIDNGISGDIAGRVGDILLRTSKSIQLLAITHLPQIAGKARVQYNVYKKISASSTISGIRLLNDDERVEELARMISGSEITTASRQTARELLSTISIFDN